METDNNKHLVEAMAAGLQDTLIESQLPSKMTDLLVEIEAAEQIRAARDAR